MADPFKSGTAIVGYAIKLLTAFSIRFLWTVMFSWWTGYAWRAAVFIPATLVLFTFIDFFLFFIDLVGKQLRKVGAYG